MASTMSESMIQCFPIIYSQTMVRCSVEKIDISKNVQKVCIPAAVVATILTFARRNLGSSNSTQMDAFPYSWTVLETTSLCSRLPLLSSISNTTMIRTANLAGLPRRTPISGVKNFSGFSSLLVSPTPIYKCTRGSFVWPIAWWNRSHARTSQPL